MEGTQGTPEIPASSGTPTAPDKDARMYGMLCHLLALTGLFGNGIGFILGPLIVWLVKKDQHPFIDEQGKESLNFQISMLIYAIVSAILIVVLIGALLLSAIAIIDVVLVIIAAIKANEGESYKYPLTIRFIK